MQIAKRHIGRERTALLEAVQADRRPHRFYLSDWQKIEAFLRMKLPTIQPEFPASDINYAA